MNTCDSGRDFSLTVFLALNFLLQLIACAVFSPFILQKVVQDATIYNYVIFLTYMTFLIGFVQFGIYAAGHFMAFLGINLMRRASLFLQFLWCVFITASFVIFLKLNVHLDHPVVLDLARLTDGNWGIIPSMVNKIKILLALLLIFAIQGQISRFANSQFYAKWRGAWTRRNQLRLGVLTAIFLVNFVFSALFADMGALREAALPGGFFFSRLFVSPVIATLKPEFFEFQTVELAKKPNVVIVMSDAFRNDVPPALTPHLNALRKTHCSVGSRHYAGSHMTSYGGFTLWHGMESYLYRPVTETKNKSRVLTTLRTNGYRLEAFDVSGLTSYSPPVVAGTEFDIYKTYPDRTKIWLSDQTAIDDFTSSWRKRDHEKPYAAFIFFFSTHEPYSSPDTDLRHPAQNNDDRGRYEQSIQYVDKLVGSISKEIGPETVFIFTGDHGEEFGEFGSRGHSSVRFEDVRTRVPLVFCLPGHQWSSVPLSSHADLWPTIFDWMGAPEAWRKRSMTGRSLLRRSEVRSFIPLTGAYFPSNGRQMALALPDGKILMRATGVFPYEMEVIGRLGEDDQLREQPFLREDEALTELRQDMTQYFY